MWFVDFVPDRKVNVERNDASDISDAVALSVTSDLTSGQ